MGKEDESFFSRQIKRKDIPCWYELSWSEENLAIILRLHNDFIHGAQILSDKTPLVRSLAKSHQLGSFSGDFKGNIGFEECLKNRGKEDNFTQYHLELPRVKVASEKRCTTCGGSGHIKWLDDVCFSCNGSGKGHEMITHTAYCASASLTTLSLLLQFGDKKTSSPLPQLLTINTNTRTEPHGGDFGGEISRPLRDWLINYQGHNTFPKVTRTMFSAYNQMYPLASGNIDNHRFKTLVWDNGGLCMDCPGNACGINPSYNTREEGGYEFGGHNIDSPMQQLTLIAGLAALTDQARREIVYSE